MRFICIILIALLPIPLFSLSKSELKYLEANGYMRNKQYDKALALYNDSISAEAEFLPALQMKYVTLNKLGKKTDADAANKKLLAVKSKNAADSGLCADYLIASELANTGESEKALTAFKKAFDKNIERYTPLALYEMGDVLLFGLSRFEEAETGFEKSLKIDPINEFAWFNMGYSQAQTGKYQDALASFDSAIKLDDRNAFYWQNKGVVLIVLKRYDESITALNRCLALNSSNPDAWSYKGQAYEALGNKTEAQKCYAKEKTLRGSK
jgi:tetratricopeptide (TPR) repeat protein